VRAEIAACAGQPLPRKALRLTKRACQLFYTAAVSEPRRAKRKLLAAADALRAARHPVLRAGRTKAIPAECASTLIGRIQDARERAAKLAATL
jgi:hypothetical protein